MIFFFSSPNSIVIILRRYFLIGNFIWVVWLVFLFYFKEFLGWFMFSVTPFCSILLAALIEL